MVDLNLFFFVEVYCLFSSFVLVVWNCFYCLCWLLLIIKPAGKDWACLVCSIFIMKYNAVLFPFVMFFISFHFYVETVWLLSCYFQSVGGSINHRFEKYEWSSKGKLSLEITLAICSWYEWTVSYFFLFGFPLKVWFLLACRLWGWGVLIEEP